MKQSTKPSWGKGRKIAPKNKKYLHLSKVFKLPRTENNQNWPSKRTIRCPQRPLFFPDLRRIPVLFARWAKTWRKKISVTHFLDTPEWDRERGETRRKRFRKILKTILTTEVRSQVRAWMDSSMLRSIHSFSEHRKRPPAHRASFFSCQGIKKKNEGNLWKRERERKEADDISEERVTWRRDRSSENPEYRGRTGKVSPFDGLCNNRLKTVKNVIPCFSSVEGRLWM